MTTQRIPDIRPGETFDDYIARRKRETGLQGEVSPKVRALVQSRVGSGVERPAPQRNVIDEMLQDRLLRKLGLSPAFDPNQETVQALREARASGVSPTAAVETRLPARPAVSQTPIADAASRGPISITPGPAPPQIDVLRRGVRTTTPVIQEGPSTPVNPPNLALSGRLLARIPGLTEANLSPFLGPRPLTAVAGPALRPTVGEALERLDAISQAGAGVLSPIAAQTTGRLAALPGIRTPFLARPDQQERAAEARQATGDVLRSAVTLDRSGVEQGVEELTEQFRDRPRLEQARLGLIDVGLGAGAVRFATRAVVPSFAKALNPSRALTQTDDVFKEIADVATRGEQPAETLLRRHEGAVGAAENEARIIVDEGGQSLRRAGTGQAVRGRTVPREADIPALDELFNALHNPSAVEAGQVAVPTILPARLRDSLLRVRQAVDEGVETYRTQGPRPAEIGGIPEREIPTAWRAGVDPQLESMGMRRTLPIEDVGIEDVKLEVAMEARADHLDAVAREMKKRGVKVPRDRNDFAKTDVYGEIEAVQRANTESGRRANTLLFDAVARRHGGKSIADEFDILYDVSPSETGGRLDPNRLAADWEAIGQPEVGIMASRDARQVMDEVEGLLYDLPPVTPSTTARPVEAGQVAVPTQFADDYTRLRDLTDWETVARIDFDPNTALVDDYFYRGWKPPEGMFSDSGQLNRGRVGTRPAFKMPRVDATYREMRAAGFEPLFWNPYEQWRVSRLQGVRFRQQQELINTLKKLEIAVPDARGLGAKKWRTPKIGPAFEGRAIPTVAEDGTAVQAFTRRWVVPDKIANRLESIYGSMPDLGPVFAGNKRIDLLKAIDTAVFIPKRAKLFGSFYQQVDFTTRNFVGTWQKFVDDLYAGRPIEAVKAPLKFPEHVYTIMRANLSPNFRLELRRQLNSTEPLVPGRPGVHMKGILEAGLSTIDPTLLPGNIDEVVRTMKANPNLPARAVQVLGDVESAMRRGLFEGVYPAAQITDIRDNIAHVVAREAPAATDQQLNGMIARRTNIKYSTIPASQGQFQNPVVRGALKRVMFSPGEAEGLLRQAFGAIGGPDAAFWRKHWIGAYLGLIAGANALHFASTREPLPAGRYSPIARDGFGPLPVGYNREFASPNLPFTGRSGVPLMLDLVGQLDTAFRVFDPLSFLKSRESVPVRAVETQLTGETFTGQEIGGLARIPQAAVDVLAPIGPGQAILEEVAERVPAVGENIAVAEPRIGTVGRAMQAPGLNVRAETTPQLLDRAVSTVFPPEQFPNKERYMERFVRDRPEFSPELALRLEESIGRGRALFSGKLKEINEAEMRAYQVLIDTGRVNFVNVDRIRRKFRGQRQGAGIGEEFEGSRDPVLSQYYALLDDPQLRHGFSMDGDINSVRFNQAYTRLLQSFTPEQRAFLLRNTNLRPTPIPILNALSAPEQNSIQQSQRARMDMALQAGRRDLAQAMHNWFYVTAQRR